MNEDQLVAVALTKLDAALTADAEIKQDLKEIRGKVTELLLSEARHESHGPRLEALEADVRHFRDTESFAKGAFKGSSILWGMLWSIILLTVGIVLKRFA